MTKGRMNNSKVPGCTIEYEVPNADAKRDMSVRYPGHVARLRELRDSVQNMYSYYAKIGENNNNSPYIKVLEQLDKIIDLLENTALDIEDIKFENDGFVYGAGDNRGATRRGFDAQDE